MSERECKHGNEMNDYQIVGLLGKGGLSMVFEVECRRCNRRYALKMVDKQKVRTQSMTQKLVNEIEVHQSLRHERIVELRHYFEDNSCVYLLLELCKNGELYTVLQSKGTFPDSEARWLFKQLVEGVKYLHDNNVIHRDLKLANVMLTDQGNVKIGDFGLAVKLKDISEERDTLCGTPSYISPEIVKRQPHGRETDIWSMGCILYALLVGRPPFESPDVQDTLLKVRDCNYELPETLPREAKELLCAMFSREPKKRISVDQILAHPYVLGATSPSNSSRILNFPSLPPPRALSDSEPEVGTKTAPDTTLKADAQAGVKANSKVDSRTRVQLSQGSESRGLCRQQTVEASSKPLATVQAPPTLSRTKSERVNATAAKAAKKVSGNFEARAQTIRGSADGSRGKENEGDPLNASRGTKHKREDLPYINTQRLTLCSRVVKGTGLIAVLMGLGNCGKPITHSTPHGCIRIDDSGCVEVEIANRSKIMHVSPDGQRITIYSKIIENCNVEYEVGSLPTKFRSIYRYVADFVNVLRSQTPKVTYRCADYKCHLMDNLPLHNCELRVHDGTKAVYTLGSSVIEITTAQGKQFRINHNDDYPYLSSDLRTLLDTFFAAIKHCVEAEQLAEAHGCFHFPLLLTPDTDLISLRCLFGYFAFLTLCCPPQTPLCDIIV